MEAQQWLITFKVKLYHDFLKWNPNLFIVDNTHVEINVIK